MIVVMVFLQTWRASIIPLVAVPVSLIGTFAVMLGLGFSLNTLSLFGLVLSIGIVVDDAIVVVENVERHIELGLPPLEATRRAMEEVSGPIIAIALVLCAVFVPTAFVSGLTGQFYRQFALTIAISTVISAFNSLTLSPALASRLLKPRDAKRDAVQRAADRLFGWFFRGSTASSRAHRGVRWVSDVSCGSLRSRSCSMSVSSRSPGLASRACLPGSCRRRTRSTRRVRTAPGRRDPGPHRRGDSQDVVDCAQTSRGSQLGRVSRSLHQQLRQCLQFRDRLRRSEALGGADEPGLRANAIVQDLNRQFFGTIQDAIVAIFPPPSVQGLGQVGGFKLYVEDRGGNGFEELYGQLQASMAKAQQAPSLAGLFSSFQVSVPQIQADVDRERVKSYGVELTDVFETLQVYLGSLYVNDFNRFGRTTR